MNKTLYKQDSKGRLRLLKVTTENGNVIQESGLLDGKTVMHIRECSPKNTGRANATTSEEQAIIEATSIVKRKIREGYSESVEDAMNNTTLLPMLAKSVNSKELTFPVYTQPKLDGMRAFCTNESAISRTNKKIETVNHVLIDIDDGITLDGELYAHGITFQENMKLIKKARPETVDIKFHVYDLPSAPGGFADRYSKLAEVVKGYRNVELVETATINTVKELEEQHAYYLSLGYEGTIIRIDGQPYEFNKRSSQLLKFKDFIDEVYPIIDVVPSSRVPEQGVVRCVAPDGQEFNCGMKMTHEERTDILLNKDKVIGKKAEVRFFEYTDGGLPRFPVYHGYRLDK